MKLTLVEHSEKQFTYSARKNILVADASDLNNRHLERLYDDACDVGFEVKSERTGKVITFVMVSPFYIGSGEDREVGGWHYVPTTESFRNVPECQGMEAEIFND
jgi:hypothetical protein